MNLNRNLPKTYTVMRPMRYLVTSTMNSSEPNFLGNEQKEDEDKVYNRNEQTISGTTNQISHTKTAYDRETINPNQEIHEFKKINHQDSLEWSAANENISDTNKKKSSQPVG
ncbi:7374_t:CDS:2 [Funneliformis geosporum]|uniref:5702_t:CDS:1 n=1 Tax=Funneliformis geosporum TaxID=1117311 RepID=A0A9W4SVB6_9GLOM|nr:7374_t:CDS:2 [Funneliformis geosporum]CAI2182730.1 5702_t:CDS:2 [Funneliformis geosporum]